MNHACATTLAALVRLSSAMRHDIVERSHAAGVGHIGSALSVVEILAVLWGEVLRRPGTADPDRDRFVLCKGHASLALYAAMRHLGLLDEATFGTYCADGTLLGVHPEHTLPGVDVSTGSLGQGLSVACGLAYGLRLRGAAARVCAVLSDAECNEGQVWEAAQFAAHHRLGNLLAVVDCNGSQAMGRTRDVLDLEPLADKWRAFSWDVADVDGHDVAALLAALRPASDRPRLVIARTVLGKGVSFMEGQVAWHYLPLRPQEYQRALAELGAGA